MYGSRVGLSLLVVVLLLVFTSSAKTSGAADTESGGLFHELDGDPPPVSGINTLAGRLVGIDSGRLAQAIESPVGPRDAVTGVPLSPKTLELNLLSGVVFTGIVEHVEPTASGHALWGRLDGIELGTMTLVVNGSVVVGTVRTPDAVYTIRTVGDGRYAIRQIDESSLPPLGEPLEAPLSPRDTPQQSVDVPPDDGSEIDVMVVYTPLAKHREGGRAAIEALIDLLVAETNQAYANSGVIHRIRLVLREEVDYVEDGNYVYDGNSHIDLSRLRRDSDGYMDHVHELRDLYAADLVHIVVGRGDTSGVAAGVGGDESFGFALTNSPGSSVHGGVVFAHELGHNMGLDHDRYTLGAASVPVRGSNYGYVNQRMFEPNAPESARWITIMAYSRQCWELGCSPVPYFSNPDLTYNGDPMGVPVDHPSRGVDGPADAVRTLNDRREITANFRRSSTSPTPRVGLALSQYWLAEDGGVSKVTATLHRPSSSDTTVTISASPADAVTLDAKRTLTIPAGDTVSVDSVTITGVDNADQTGDVNVTVSATATNTSDQGVIAPEPVELAIADDETTPVVTLTLSPEEVFEGGDRNERRILVTTTLDNRSSAATTVTLSVSPTETVEEMFWDTLTIPAGQLVSDGFTWLITVDDMEYAEAKKSVTVSGTATNPQGVKGPDSVTLTVIDDDAPIFADDSIAFTFTAGVAGHRVLPEAEFGNGPLTYSISPALSNDVTFDPGPPARIGVSSTSVVAGETSYTLTATDAEGDTDTMTVSIAVVDGVCPNSAAVSGYTDPGIVRDCEALLVSKRVLGGEQSLNWSVDLSIGNWQGIEIVDNRVVGMDMSSLGLSGTIPSELGDLSSLQSLDLSQNELTGTIPSELGDLSSLQSLDLSQNELTGTIPSELGDLSSLQSLDLSQNKLTGEIPREVGNLVNLRLLNLGVNQMVGTIPEELGDLVNLQQLNLEYNQLTGEVPGWLNKLNNLRTLDLRNNQLTGGIPASLGDLENLTALLLDRNQLTGEIPSWLNILDNLRQLGLGDNQLTGEVPVELSDLPHLTRLYLEGNQLTGEVPGWLNALFNLTTLNLERNQLTGEIPVKLGDLTELQRLNLGGNQLTGPIPIELGNLAELQSLSLSDNQLTGGIPKELGNLSNLNWLFLNDNLLTGQIPLELGKLANLTDLFLRGNDFTGCMPEGLLDVASNDLHLYVMPFCNGEVEPAACVTGGAVTDATNTGLISDCEALLEARDILAGSVTLNWAGDTPIADWDGVGLGGTPRRVTRLSLAGKGLSGTIPPVLGRLSMLTHLNLRSNPGLSGEIPAELGDLSNLRVLNLHSNSHSGPIPDLSRITGLEEMYLPNNEDGSKVQGSGLTGEIPTWLNDMTNMKELWLWGNSLSGTIPDLSGMTSLDKLKLANNDLTGGVPEASTLPPNMTWLIIDRNPFGGTIPDLSSLSRLRLLWLHTNGLTGLIPVGSTFPASLDDLNLRDNMLTGEIPDLSNLDNLTRLRLHNNSLSGEVPATLGNLDMLMYLWLHNEVDKGLGSNSFTSIAAGVGGLEDTLIQIALNGNPWNADACVPAELANVAKNDYEEAGIEVCSDDDGS